MAFTRVLGQDLAKQIIGKALKNHSVAHAYLFYGPESIGKKLAAIEFAKALNCVSPSPEGGCDICTSCRKIDQGIHPDFFLVEPTKTSPTAKEAAIRIDEIRELQRKLGLQPYEGKTKVAVVDSAESMNAQAGNSFLKTLEEPSPSTVLILIASNLYQLLPTVISRCQRIQFTPLPTKAIRQILSSQENMDPVELDLRILHSRGQVNRALEHNTASQCRQDLMRLIETVSLDNVEVVFEWARVVSKQTDTLSTVLDQLMCLIRDLAYIKTRGNVNDLYNKDLAVQLKPLAAKKTLPEIVNMYDSVQQTKYSLSANANTQLSLENMFLRFCDAA